MIVIACQTVENPCVQVENFTWWKRDLYNVSKWDTIKRWKEDMTCGEMYRVVKEAHPHQPQRIAVWRGALFNCTLYHLMQWGPFTDIVWSPKNHKLFPKNIREDIKTLVIVSQTIPSLRDAIFTIIPFVAAVN